MRGSKRFAWTLAAPGILGLVAVSIVPFVWMVITAFQKFSPNPRIAPKFAGLDNLYALFADPQFVGSIWVTLEVSIAALVLELTIGFFVAWSLYHVRKGRAVIVSLLLIPTAIAPLIAGIVWWMLFNTKFGAVNAILIDLFGMNPIEWTIKMPFALIAVVVATVWQQTPFVSVILLGGLTTIPGDVLEAARVDGAAGWRQLRHVVLPLMKPFFLVSSLFMVIELMRLYEMPQFLTTGGPGNETVVLGIYLFKLAFSFFDLGRASMMSLLYVIVLSIIGLLFARLMRTSRR